jgi:hypothetical protein
MKLRLLAIAPALVLLLVVITTPRTGMSAATCPSSTPSCTAGGILSDFQGIFGCTTVATNNTGQVYVAVLKIDADGIGGITGSIVSNNNGSGTTFADFTAISGATYCVNPDDTGYVFGVGSPCAKALIIDDALGEVRMIGSDENNAEAITCRLQ